MKMEQNLFSKGNEITVLIYSCFKQNISQKDIHENE